MKYAKVNNSSSKTMTCTLDGVSVHRVDREALRAAIDAWKPDMAAVAKYTSPSLFRGLVDLFLITDILYAGHVTVENETSGSIGAGVDSGVAGTLFRVNAAVDVEAEHSNGSKRDITGGDIPFAIKVVRLRYNSKGELHRIIPETRSASELLISTEVIEVEILPSGAEILPPVVREEHVDVHVSKSEVVYRPSETIDVGEGDTNGIVVKAVEGHREGDAPGTVSETVVVEAPELVEGVEQSEPVAEKNELWVKNNYDPLSEYECEMGDFFGDDLSDLAGDGSVIELAIDVEADSEPAESATVHTS